MLLAALAIASSFCVSLSPVYGPSCISINLHKQLSDLLWLEVDAQMWSQFGAELIHV